MHFFLFITSILLIIRYMDNKKLFRSNYVISYSLIALLFLLIYSLQRNVGTDYISYLEGGTLSITGQAKLRIVLADYEYLSALIMYLTQQFFQPQMILFFYALIQVFVFGIIIRILIEKNYDINYIILFYFTVCVNFFNSFNAVRQCTAIPLFILSIILINDRDFIKSILSFILACLFHHSALFLSPLLILIYVLRIKRIEINFYLLVILFMGLASLYFIDLNYIINRLLSVIPSFSNLANRDYVSKMSYLNILTRVLKVLPLFYCYRRINRNKLSDNQLSILNVSCISMLVLALSFSSSIVWRIFGYFDLFLMYPLLIYFKQSNNSKEKTFLCLWFISMLLIKIVLFPNGEYLYHSIVFK